MESERPPIRRALTVTLDRLAALLIVSATVLLVSFHPPAAHPPPPRLIVIGIDGLCWPILSPAMVRGDVPVLSRLVNHTRGVLIPTPDQPRQAFWDWIGLTRTPSVRDPSDRVALGPRPLWDVLSNAQTVGMVGWPGLGGVRVYPEGASLDLPIINHESAPGDIPTSSVERLAWDRGHVSATLKLMEMYHPDDLLIGFGGPFTPESGSGPEHAMTPGSPYWRSLDRELERLLSVAHADTTVLILGRGLGPEGTPAAEGLFIGEGPGLARGPLPRPIRADEVGPTVAYLAEVRLPIGALTLPVSALVDPAWSARHPVCWEVNP